MRYSRRDPPPMSFDLPSPQAAVAGAVGSVGNPVSPRAGNQPGRFHSSNSGPFRPTDSAEDPDLSLPWCGHRATTGPRHRAPGPARKPGPDPRRRGALRGNRSGTSHPLPVPGIPRCERRRAEGDLPAAGSSSNSSARLSATRLDRAHAGCWRRPGGLRTRRSRSGCRHPEESLNRTVGPGAYEGLHACLPAKSIRLGALVEAVG